MEVAALLIPITNEGVSSCSVATIHHRTFGSKFHM